MKSALRPGSADAHVGPAHGRVAHAVERSRRVAAAVGDRDGVDHAVPRAARRAVGATRRGSPSTLAGRGGHLRRVGRAVHEDLVGQGALADAERSSASSRPWRSPDFAIVEASELPSWSHSAERQRGSTASPTPAARAAARDDPRPAASTRGSRWSSVRQVRPVQARPELRAARPAAA
jgi:hypothetical protein